MSRAPDPLCSQSRLQGISPFPEATGRPESYQLGFGLLSANTGLPRVGLKGCVWTQLGRWIEVPSPSLLPGAWNWKIILPALPPATNHSCSGTVVLLFEKRAEKTLYLGMAFLQATTY